MAKVLPKPISLRPRNSIHRRWFWGLMSLGALMIVVGWMVTIHGILKEVPAMTTKVEEGVDRTVQEVHEAQLAPVETDAVSEAFQALKNGYETEKQRQEQTSSDPEIYGQEASTY